VFPLVYAVFLALLWSWIAAKVPHPLFERSIARGLLVIPFVGAFADLAENVGFLTLVFANPRNPLHDVTIATLAIHRVKYLIVNADTVITLMMAAIAGVRWLRTRRVART
jgi:hypothetical protein